MKRFVLLFAFVLLLPSNGCLYRIAATPPPQAYFRAEILWTKNFEKTVSLSPIILPDGKMIVVAGNEIHLLEGKEVIHSEQFPHLWNKAIEAKGDIILCSKETLICWSEKERRTLWSMSEAENIKGVLGVNSNDELVCLTDSEILFVDLESGRIIETLNIVSLKSENKDSRIDLKDEKFSGVGFVDGGTVYAATAGNLLCAVSREGAVLWLYDALGAIGATPVKFKRRIFLASDDKKVIAISARSGRRLWRLTVGGNTFAPLVIHNRTLFVAPFDLNLYALRPRTGSRVWNANLPKRADSIVAAPPFGMLVKALFDPTIFLFDLKNGVKTMTFTLEDKNDYFTSPLVFKGETVFAGTYRGKLYALKIKQETKPAQNDLTKTPS